MNGNLAYYKTIRYLSIITKSNLHKNTLKKTFNCQNIRLDTKNKHDNEYDDGIKLLYHLWSSLGNVCPVAPPNTYKCLSKATIVCPYLFSGGGGAPRNMCSVEILVHLIWRKQNTLYITSILHFHILIIMQINGENL